MFCPLCDDTLEVVDPDTGATRPCVFHAGATLVTADPAAIATLRTSLFRDQARQHQLEPASYTTPGPDPRGYFLRDTRPLGARLRSIAELVAVLAAIALAVVYVAGGF